MKNQVFNFFVLSIFVFTFNSCDNNEENNSAQNLEGKYSGTFTVEYASGDTFSNPVTVSFDGENEFQSSGNANHFPAGGSGTYAKNDSTIIFNDNNFWTANFDWNLILNGEYNYTKDGNELLISAHKNDLGLYKYDLTKEK